MGGKTSTTTQGVSIPKEVMDRYNAINARAENVAGTPFQTYSEDPSKFVAQLNAQQQQGIGNVNAAAGAYKPYFDQAALTFSQGMRPAQPGELNTSQFMNPFQQQVIDATMKQMGQANQQAQSGALGTAISSGAFGGDRAGIAAANLANQQGLAMGSTLAGLNAQNYSQALAAAQQQQGVNLGATQADLARLMQGGQFYAGLGTAAQQAGLQGAEAQINAGTLGQQTEQAGLSALYNQFQQKNAYPFQVAQFLANIGMGTGALSGSTTTTTQPSSFFSDRRLKEDVQRIGEGDNGLPIYKYRYKGEPDTHIGFMADEVEKVRPEAVGLHPTGYKTVDYDRATKAEGGVAGPYGSSVGSQPGMAGYVPEAYLPVGQLMVADSGALGNAEQSMAEQLDAVARFGSNLAGLKETFGKDGDFWLSNEQRRALAAAGQKTDPASGAWRGGVAGGYADGGAAYLNTGLRDRNPVEKQTYLSDIVSGQEDAKRRDSLQSPGSVPQARTTGQDVADLAKVALAFMGMNRGGRTGYATRGSVEDMTPEERRQYIADMRAFSTRDPGISRDAAATGLNPVAYLGGDAATAPQSEYAPSVSLRPQPRPEGLVSPLAPMVSQRPERRSPYAAVDRMTPEERQQYTADLRNFTARDPYVEKASTSLGVNPIAYIGGDLAAPAPSYAPETSLRPQPRPAGLVPGPGMEDLTAAGIGGLRTVPVADTTQKGVALAAIPQTGPQVDTGKVASGSYDPVVPVQDQLNFVTHELQKPEYDDYIKTRWSSPEDAAVGFDTIYERSGGSGNDVAAKNARDIYEAAQAGDMSGFAPNVQTAYSHFISTGMDPVQAAGATGRLMVESYAHLDPNARLIDGSGNGTYGIAQWRGDRLEELSRFTGIPLKDIVGAPSSTPEGRYYSANGVAGPGASTREPSGLASGVNAPMGGDKAYEDRTTLGKMFYNPNGSVNKDALLSILGGLGAMASSPSRYLGAAILQGVGGAANTYAALEKQRSDVVAKNVENMSKLVELYNNYSVADPRYADMSIEDFAKAQGLEALLPKTGIDYQTGSGFDVTKPAGSKITTRDINSYLPGPEGSKIPFMNDYASLERVYNAWNGFAEGTMQRRIADQAKVKLDEIVSSGGYTTAIGPDNVPITIPVPAVLAKIGYKTIDDANNAMTNAFREQAAQTIDAVEAQKQNIQNQIDLYTEFAPGMTANLEAKVSAAAKALGLGDGATAADVQKAMKDSAQATFDLLGPQATGNEMKLVNAFIADATMEPEAIKFVLTMQKAKLDRQLKMATEHAVWQRTEAKNPNDFVEFQTWFAKNYPMSKFVEEAGAQMPQLAGEPGNGAQPTVGDTKTFEGSDGKTYTGKWDGKGWVRQ